MIHTYNTVNSQLKKVHFFLNRELFDLRKIYLVNLIAPTLLPLPPLLVMFIISLISILKQFCFSFEKQF